MGNVAIGANLPTCSPKSERFEVGNETIYGMRGKRIPQIGRDVVTTAWAENVDRTARQSLAFKRMFGSSPGRYRTRIQRSSMAA
jgi:AraC-like DNA-binding protein